MAQRLELEDVTIAYEERAGSGGHVAIVLVHGLGGSFQSWWAQLAAGGERGHRLFQRSFVEETMAGELKIFGGRAHPALVSEICDYLNLEAGKVFSTKTNAADQREYYAFHQDPSWTGVVHWRVRASRILSGKVQNELPAVSYGPWSPVFTSPAASVLNEFSEYRRLPPVTK